MLTRVVSNVKHYQSSITNPAVAAVMQPIHGANYWRVSPLSTFTEIVTPAYLTT
jgi:hypothetical protein